MQCFWHLTKICEFGISTHGAHITGAMSVCNQLRLSETLTARDERAIFFLGKLAWSIFRYHWADCP
jgi:hypothetical protein